MKTTILLKVHAEISHCFSPIAPKYCHLPHVVTLHDHDWAKPLSTQPFASNG